MKQPLTLRIILTGPPPGVAWALQEFSAAKARPVQSRHSTGSDLTFTLPVFVKDKDAPPPGFSPSPSSGASPAFSGSFVQGPPAGRFIYIGIGSFAGQPDSPWSRRIKVPLAAITAADVAYALTSPGSVLEARIPGTGKDGTPSSATIRPPGGWQIKPA